MEREVLDILSNLLDEKLKPVHERLDKMDSRLDNMDSRLDKVDSRLDKMDGKIDKNAVMLEKLDTNVKIIAEVQKAHIEQDKKKHVEIIKPLSEKVDVIELAVKDISKEVKELKEKFDKVEKVTMQNTYDVAYLKSVK